eukprot:2824297-Rhodomonas_salina.1
MHTVASTVHPKTLESEIAPYLLQTPNTAQLLPVQTPLLPLQHSSDPVATNQVNDNVDTSAQPLLKTLRERFKLDTFRGGQFEVISSILTGRDT